MSIAWTTIAIVLVLLPGAAFYAGLYSEERVARVTTSNNIFSEFVGVIFFALILHLVSYVIYYGAVVLCGCLFSCDGNHVLSIETLVTVSRVDLSKPLHDVIAALKPATTLIPTAVIYIIVSSVLGYGAGYYTGSHAIDGWMRPIVRNVFIKHGWVYDIISALEQARKDDTGGAPVSVFIMTKIEIDGHVLMYHGFLHDLFLRADGTISYLILHGGIRYTKNANAGEYVSTDRQPISDVPFETSETPLNVFIVEGNEIENVYFEHFVLTGLEDIEEDPTADTESS